MTRFTRTYLIGILSIILIVVASCQAIKQDPEAILASNTESIAASLRQVQEEGGESNFVVLIADESKNYYIQFSGKLGDPVLYAEAVGNRYLTPENALTSGQHSQLVSLGWNLPDGGSSQNFYRSWSARSEDDRLFIAGEVMKTFEEVYAIPADQPITIELVLE